MVFQTKRLLIRLATPTEEDVDVYYRLWNHPRVMTNVGFPQGLGISKAEITTKLAQVDNAPYNCRLLVIRKQDGVVIGESKLGFPDKNGVSSTDVKLFPEYWNQGYGTEIKQGLVDYLFTHLPECMAVKADPAKHNIGSQKMQEHVGGVRIEPGKEYPIQNAQQYFPESDQYFLYMVFRENWQNSRTAD